MNLKLLILAISILVLPVQMNGQVFGAMGKLNFEDTLRPDPMHEWISINDPDSNIWEIGKPCKVLFDRSIAEIRKHV